jgi:D-alanyl-D-alanine dipeptidase
VNLDEEFAQRVERIRAEMERQRVDYLLVGPSTDLVFTIGYNTKLSERLTMLVVPREGMPQLVMPDFELPAVASLPALFEPLPWSDGVDAAAFGASLFKGKGSLRIGVGAQLQARFLIDLIAAGLQADFVNGDIVLAPVRVRKSAYEIDALRQASRVTDEVIDELERLPLEGTTELELVGTLQRLVAEHGNEPVGTGLAAFGENAAAPHHHSSDRAARPGDAVIVDYGGTWSHYRADITRMLHLGAPSDEFRRVYDVVNQANQVAFERVAPGVPAQEIDAAAREHIQQAGYGDFFLHRTGHGIGLDIHEPPYIVRGNGDPLEPGMAFTIEPGIYLEGLFGVRVEDVVLVTPDGAERLNTSNHDVRVVS